MSENEENNIYKGSSSVYIDIAQFKWYSRRNKQLRHKY